MAAMQMMQTIPWVLATGAATATGPTITYVKNGTNSTDMATGVEYYNIAMQRMTKYVEHLYSAQYAWTTDGIVNSSTSTSGKWCQFTYGVYPGFATNNFANFAPQKTAQDRLREIIANRQAPNQFRRESPGRTTDNREARARETLRQVVGEEQYRNFLRAGFVSASNSKSGRIYQIFGGTKFVNVYEHGRMIERLCVYLTGDFPPTDQIIVRYLMALNNEDELWKIAIKHGPSKLHWNEQSGKVQPLTEIYRQLKIAG